MKKKNYKLAYRNQRNDAALRRIDFLLTFEEWLQIWVDSGHLHERGPGRGQYQMARFGDKGPYVVGNVKIVTREENQADAWERQDFRENHRAKLIGNTRRRGKTMSLESRAKTSQKLKGRKQTPEHVARATASKIGNTYALGFKHSEETCKKVSGGQRRSWARRKALVAETVSCFISGVLSL